MKIRFVKNVGSVRNREDFSGILPVILREKVFFRKI